MRYGQSQIGKSFSIVEAVEVKVAYDSNENLGVVEALERRVELLTKLVGEMIARLPVRDQLELIRTNNSSWYPLPED
jgi:hypothetical protein